MVKVGTLSLRRRRESGGGAGRGSESLVAATYPPSGPRGQLLALQRTCGNAAACRAVVLAGGSASGGPATAIRPMVAAPVSAGGSIRSTSEVRAPDRGPRSRSRIGPGERVYLRVPRRGLWSATAGQMAADPVWAQASTDDPRVTKTRRTIWTAPETGGAVTITVRQPGGVNVQLLLTVVPPESIRLTRISTTLAGGDALPVDGTAGAAMRARVRLYPIDVSFARVQWLEMPQAEGDGVTGYFSRLAAADTGHNPGRDFALIDNANSWVDTLWLRNLPPPFEFGQFYWTIPNRYRVVGSGSAGILFTTTHQFFVITASGAVSISKQGAHVIRTITGRVT